MNRDCRPRASRAISISLPLGPDIRYHHRGFGKVTTGPRQVRLEVRRRPAGEPPSHTQTAPARAGPARSRGLGRAEVWRAPPKPIDRGSWPGALSREPLSGLQRCRTSESAPKFCEISVCCLKLTVRPGPAMTARSKLRGQKKEAASSSCPFAPVESFLVAKVSIGVRRCCGDIDRVVTACPSTGHDHDRDILDYPQASP